MSPHIHLDDYVSGGYFITKQIKRPEGMSAELLPDRIVTLSGCSGWGPSHALNLNWPGGPDCAVSAWSDFGITSEKVDELSRWIVSHDGKEVGFPDTIYRLETAREIAHRFVPPRDDLLLVAIGLHRSLLSEHLVDEPAVSILSAVNRRESLAAGGEVLGFDIVNYYHELIGLGCTWLCVHLDRDAWEKFGIRVNDNGLIGTFDEAKKVADYAMEIQAEPGTWIPLLVVKYPLDTRA